MTTKDGTTQNPSASDWAAARGAKWRAQLAGMEAMLRPIDEPLIAALQLGVPCRVADVGCGGGGTALEILRRAPAGSVVHGFDISTDLIQLACERTPPDARAIAFETANVATSSPMEPYERIVSRFGVMFFDDPEAAFANLVSWLAPGGRFAFAVWSSTSENPWMTSVREVVADIVDLPPTDPLAPGAFRYGDVDPLRALLEQAGFAELDVRDWRGRLPIGGELPCAEAAQFALAAFSSFGELLAQAGEEAFAEARRALTARLSRHEANGAVWMDACVHIVTGARPQP
jgi:SAM-dependent methyltransferase